MEKILITGALGQLGTDLLEGLTERYGPGLPVAHRRFACFDEFFQPVPGLKAVGSAT